MASATTSGSGLRLRKSELFKMLGYEPHPGQILVHRSRAPRRVLVCGVRFGKSTCGAMEAVAALMEPREKSLGWTVAPTYSLADLIFSRIVAIVQDRLPHRLIECSPREHRIVLRNLGGGLSEVRSKSADRPVGLLGEGLNWVIVDEAARLPRAIWEEHLSQRLIDRKGWALLISTPHSSATWLYRLFRRGQGHRDVETQSWSFASWDNPHLDRGMIESQRPHLGEDEYREIYGGEFLNMPIEECELCHGPSPDIPGSILADGPGDFEACPECGFLVDENGRSVVSLTPDGVPSLHVIVLMDREEGVSRPSRAGEEEENPSPPSTWYVGMPAPGDADYEGRQLPDWEPRGGNAPGDGFPLRRSE